MKNNVVKLRLLKGEPALGIVLDMGSPTAAGILARAGFDFVVVDNQHGDWDDASSLAAFRSISLEAAVPMARVCQNDYCAIGRLLDRGALGLIVPMVNSAEEAYAAAYAMRYPPRGGRSCASVLAVHYGPDYIDWANDQLFLAVQIETAQALQRAEEILRVDGVDACWIGPFDLARSMGVPYNSSAHEEAILRVLRACRQAGKIPGIHAGSVAEARLRLEQGFLFVTVGYDGGLLQDGVQQALSQLRRLDTR